MNPGESSQQQIYFGHTAIEPGIELVWASGRIDASTTLQFEGQLQEGVASDAVWIVVDLSAVQYISSSGLKALITAWRTSRARRATLVMAGLGPRLLEIFGMIGLDQLLPLYGTLAEAIAAGRVTIQNERLPTNSE